MSTSGTVDACACFRARAMARAITGLYDATLEESGIRTTQLAILMCIRSHGAITMQALASELGLDPSTMTRTLQPLEKEGLVGIEPGEDRRVKEIVLTAKGHRRLADGAASWSRAQDLLRERIGAERFERLLADMGEVLRALRDAGTDAGSPAAGTAPER